MPFYTQGLKLVTSSLIRNTNGINKNILTNHINVSTSNRLFGKNYITDRHVYSSQTPYGGPIDAGVFVRNPKCWINGITNISCFSPAQRSGANWWQRGGTLITKKHALFAKHFVTSVLSPNGTPLIFVDENNNSIKRNIISYAYDNTDIAIALLDSEVPSNIKIAKVLPPNFQEYINTTVISTTPLNGFNNTPVLYAVGLDQEEKAILKLFTGCGAFGAGSFPNTIWYLMTNAQDININGSYPSLYPNAQQFSDWSEPIITGDSGNPLFIIIDNELVVLSAYLVPSGGPFVTNRYDIINTLIDSLSPNQGYSLTPVDLPAVYAKYS